jgi:arylsulfatase A-like enzyme
MVVNKYKLRHLSLSTDLFSHAGFNAQTAAHAATPLLRDDPPSILFLHFADPDSAGHDSGWGSRPYLTAIERSDVALGTLLTVADEAGIADRTLWIVSADHGGHDFSHGSSRSDDVEIPWIAYGPGVPRGLSVTATVSTMDTAATALAALRLPVPSDWEGQPVWAVLTGAVGVLAP